MAKIKKTVFFVLMLAFGASSAYSQVRIGSLEKPAAGAVLDLKSTPSGGYVGGLLLPSVEITDINTIPDNFINRNEITPADLPELAGLLVYNSRESSGIGKGVYVWDGTKWVKIN